MRLTLRALLAFLDGAPMAAEEQARIQAVLDSTPAGNELVLRIRTLLSQARMASPAVETAGTLQLNQVAEYLDGTLDLEATKRFEQACLKNDSALSEVAALHQILSAWIDQPTDISESLRQRVYSLAGSWETTTIPDGEALPVRSAGRESLQAAAQLLQVRELDEVPDEETPANSGKITEPLPAEMVEPRPAFARVPSGKTVEREPESTSSGSWVLVVLAVIGVGILWSNQSAMFHSNTLSVEAVTGPDSEPPSTNQGANSEIQTTPFKLPSLPKIDSEVARPSSLSTLPPITFSSASSINEAEINLPTKNSGDLPSNAPLSSLPSVPSVLDNLSPTLPNMQLDLVPDLIPGLATAPDTEVATNETDSVDSDSVDSVKNSDTVEASVARDDVGVASGLVVGETIGGAGTAMASPLQPRILELPPVEEETVNSVAASGLAGNREMTDSSASMSTPLTAAPTTTLETPTPPNPEAPSTLATTPPAIPTTETPVAAATIPYEWGQQVGTVVIGDATQTATDDWIVVLPGGRSQLQVRSPQGRSWRFSFSGVSRYQLLEDQGRYYLSVQRCFMVFESQAANESLEILTPKGKLFITALTPNTKVIVEVRPFLPQGSTASAVTPRYYLGCLGVQGRAIIEHQQKEELIFADKWLVVKPDGEHESFQAEMPAAIAQALQEMNGTPIPVELQQLNDLVQSQAGLDELGSIARGTSLQVANVSRDVRSLAAMWSYCLGRFEPTFDVLNDPQMRDYWETHIQAVASCLQSDPKALAQLTVVADRIGVISTVESGFVGLNAQTIKRSQVAELITELESPQVVRRLLALQALKSLTNQTFNYKPEQSVHLNRDSIQKWRQWLETSTQSRLSVTPPGGLVPSASR